MTKTNQDLLTRLEQAEKSLPPLSPKEQALKEWREAQAESNEVRKAYSLACKQFDNHAELLKTLTVTDVPVWSARLEELNVVVRGYSDLLRYKESVTERKRLAAESTFSEPDPEVMKMRLRFASLREELKTLRWNDPSNAEIEQELEELQKRMPREWVESRDPAPSKPAPLPRSIYDPRERIQQ